LNGAVMSGLQQQCADVLGRLLPAATLDTMLISNNPGIGALILAVVSARSKLSPAFDMPTVMVSSTLTCVAETCQSIFCGWRVSCLSHFKQSCCGGTNIVSMSFRVPTSAG
jgi:hypothetical protein